MAKTDDTSKTRPDRNRAHGSAEAVVAQSPSTDSFLKSSLDLMVAIEVERARLMKAESLLHCACLAMDYDDGFDDGERPYYPDVIELARELVNQTLAQLDSVTLGPMIEKLKGHAPSHAQTRESERGPDYDGVKEPHLEYRVN